MVPSATGLKDSETEKYLDDDFAEWLKSRLLEAHQPGVSVAVIRDGKIESAGFGLAQLPDIPATADTLWTMASTTKAFTTTLTGIVLEKQRPVTSTTDPKREPVTWKTPVSKVLPNFVTTDEYVTKHATIEDIASHRSGVAGHDLVWGSVMGPSLSTAAGLMKHFEAIEGKFRSTWQYNNLMYAVLGSIIEQVSEKSFEEVLREEILEPLNMKNTWLGMSKVAEKVADGTLQRTQVARGYYYVEDDEETDERKGFYIPDQHADLTGIEPAGALVSSVNDYAKWILALLKVANTKDNEKEQSTDKSIISHELWKELTTPRIHLTSVPPDSSVTLARPNSHAIPSSYCLGWVVDPYMYPGETMICHSGGMPGFSTLVTMLPDRDIGIVLAGNGGMLTTIKDVIAKELFGRRLGLSKDERRQTINKEEKEERKVPVATQLQDVPSANTIADTTDTTSDAGKPVKLDIDTATLEGHYVHPAYGTLRIRTAPASAALSEKKPSINGTRIIRLKDSEEKSKNDDYTETDKTSRSLFVTALGRRGLPSSYLLHPSRNQVDSDRLIYDLETMWAHDDISKELAKGLLPSVEESDDEQYPLKRDTAWQSIGVKEAAAVFEWAGGSSTNGARIDRVGLRLMRVDGPLKAKVKSGKSDSVLEPDWEGRMIWMAKMYT